MALSRGLRLHQYLDDWLIRSQSQEEALVNTQAVVDLTQSLGWIINKEKSELKPTQVFSLVGYEYNLDSALVKPTQERWLKLQDLILHLKSKHALTARCLMLLIGLLASTEKMVPEGCLHMRALSVSSQGALEISSVAGQPPSLDRNDFCTPRLVAETHKRDDRCGPSSQRPQHPTLYRCLKRMGKKATHKCSKVEGGLTGPSKFQGPVSEHNVESQTHSRVSECDGRPSVQVQPSSISRMVIAPSGVQTDLSEVVHPSCRSICHLSEPQTSTVRVSNSRPKCLGHRCSEHKLVWSHCLCLPSDGSPSQGDPKNQAMPLPDHSNSPGLARDALVLGPSAALNRDPTTTPGVNNSSEAVPQYVFHSNPQHLNLHAWCQGVDSSKNKASLWRWQRELLHLRGHQHGPSTSQSGPYLRKGAEKIRWIFPLHLWNKSQTFSCTCTKI